MNDAKLDEILAEVKKTNSMNAEFRKLQMDVYGEAGNPERPGLCGKVANLDTTVYGDNERSIEGLVPWKRRTDTSIKMICGAAALLGIFMVFFQSWSGIWDFFHGR